MDITLYEVIAKNQEIQSRARELNDRAGEQVFSVLTREELKAYLVERLDGARSQADVKHPERLLLPELDQELVDLVLLTNPDEIELAGRTFEVAYNTSYFDSYPIISMDLGTARACLCHMPDQVRLPGGRIVKVVIRYGWAQRFESTDLSELKDKLKVQINEMQWEQFQPRPPIYPIDAVSEDTVLPDMIVVKYGECVSTGDDLIAYGTISASESDWSSAKRLEPKWFFCKKEAENAHIAALALLEEKQEELRAEQEAKERHKENLKVSETLDEEFKKLFRHPLWKQIPKELRRDASEHQQCLRPIDRLGLKVWIMQTRRFIREINDELSNVRSTKVNAQSPNQTQATGKNTLKGVDLSQLFGGEAKVR